MEPENNRRLAILRITPEALLDLFRSGSHFRITENALPSDARVIGIGSTATPWQYDTQLHMIEVVVCSDTFAEVPEGQLLPILDPPVIQHVIE